MYTHTICIEEIIKGYVPKCQHCLCLGIYTMHILVSVPLYVFLKLSTSCQIYKKKAVNILFVY